MSANPNTPDNQATPITRADIEAKFNELRGEVDQTTEAAKTPTIGIAIGLAVLTVVVAYWLGKRKGKRRQTVLEIRRI